MTYGTTLIKRWKSQQMSRTRQKMDDRGAAIANSALLPLGPSRKSFPKEKAIVPIDNGMQTKQPQCNILHYVVGQNHPFYRQQTQQLAGLSSSSALRLCIGQHHLLSWVVYYAVFVSAMLNI